MQCKKNLKINVICLRRYPVLFNGSIAVLSGEAATSGRCLCGVGVCSCKISQVTHSSTSYPITAGRRKKISVRKASGFNTADFGSKHKNQWDLDDELKMISYSLTRRVGLGGFYEILSLIWPCFLDTHHSQTQFISKVTLFKWSLLLLGGQIRRPWLLLFSLKTIFFGKKFFLNNICFVFQSLSIWNLSLSV